VGFSVYPLLLDDTRHFTWEQVVDVADQCLYAVKRNGRNGWLGLLPGERGGGSGDRGLADLVRTGTLPTVTSLAGPIAWEPADPRVGTPSLNP